MYYYNFSFFLSSVSFQRGTNFHTLLVFNFFSLLTFSTSGNDGNKYKTVAVTVIITKHPTASTRGNTTNLTARPYTGKAQCFSGEMRLIIVLLIEANWSIGKLLVENDIITSFIKPGRMDKTDSGNTVMFGTGILKTNLPPFKNIMKEY